MEPFHDLHPYQVVFQETRIYDMQEIKQGHINAPIR